MRKPIFILIIFLLGASLAFSSPENPNESCRYDDGGNIPEGNAPCVDRGGNPNNPPASSSYNLLAPLPNPEGGPAFGTIDVGADNALGKYLNIIIKLAIGIAAVLAVVLIVMGGIQYMTTELISGKEDGKRRITNAVLGLLVALGAYLILFTINPDLLKTELDIPLTTIQYVDTPESTAAYTPISAAQLQALGVNCPGSGGTAAMPGIAQSFIGKVTYDQNRRGTISGSNIYLDCSSFAIQVYKCAGLTLPGTYSGNILTASSGAVSIPPGDLSQLGVGDVVGWRPGEDPKGPNGHVVVYIGGGQIIDLQRSGVEVRPLSSMQDRYKYIRGAVSGIANFYKFMIAQGK